MSEDNTTDTCFKSAQNMLAQREHSQSELRQKLAAKNFDPKEIEATLEELKRRNLQSDQRFTEAYIRMRANRGFGPLRIKFELRERDIEDDTIDIMVDEDSPEMDGVCSKRT